MKRIRLILTLLLLVVISSFAQKTNPLKESYNYKRALEAMQNEEDNSTIMQYLQKELEEHPKNGYAYMLQGVVYLDEQQVGQSLEALNKSVQLLKKDKECLKDAYRLRSKIQDELENDTEALADLDKALKLDPKDMDVLCDRAEFFYQRDRYEEADRDYDAMIRIEPGNTLGYMGKGRNALEQERYDEALKMFDYCVKLSPDFARAYAFRGETYMGMKKYDEAGNDLISAIDKGQDSRAFILMQDFKQPALNTLIAKVKVQMAKNRNDDYWPYYLGVLYEGDKQYRKAIDACLAQPEGFVLPQWIKDEVTKVSYRDYCTGFYFDDPHENAQISFRGGYDRAWDVMAIVEKWENGVAYCTQRNRFFSGDALEVLTPDAVPFPVTAAELFNADGERVEATNHPMMAFSFPCETPLPDGAILRKQREQN